jgi:prolyl oligopeptidase
VFLPNPRGSTGRGTEFAEANIGDLGGSDFHDVITGIDRLISTGVANSTQLVIGGWSYGGYLAAWAITQTDRFKAAVIGAGISNWLSFHGTSNIYEWDRLHHRSDPYQTRSKYESLSPLSHINRVKTPALIIHGSNDLTVHVGQSYELYRALKEHGIACELRIYPQEGHNFSEKDHQSNWITRAADWIENFTSPANTS